MVILVYKLRKSRIVVQDSSPNHQEISEAHVLPLYNEEIRLSKEPKYSHQHKTCRIMMFIG